MSAFVIGAQKAGTSTVHDVLTRAGATTPDRKETQFFTEHFDRGLGWYDDQFDGPDHRVEVDPSYLLSGDAPQRIRDTYGDDIAYVVILRDPYDRARSHHAMMTARGIEDRPLIEALRSEASEGLPLDYPDNAKRGYLSGSAYLHYLAHWEQALPNSRRMIVNFDALVGTNNASVWRQITEFLSLPAVDTSSIPASNASFAPRLRSLNRFLFDRDSFAPARSILHRLVPQSVREKAAYALYDRNKTTPTGPSSSVSSDDTAAGRALVAEHVGYGRAEIEELVGPVRWPTFSSANA